MRIPSVLVIALVVGLAGVRDVSAQAQYGSPRPSFAGVTFIVASPASAASRTPLRMSLRTPMAAQLLAQAAATQPRRPLAIEYSDAYRLRARIHKIASIATLPLFAAEGVMGQALYNNPTDGKKTAHLAIASGIGALFAVNAVTGVWNLVDSRKDPNGRTRRIVHGVLMLAASAGFAATAATGPEREGREGGQFQGSTEGSAGTHRAIAFTSIGLAAASYLIMLFNR